MASLVPAHGGLPEPLDCTVPPAEEAAFKAELAALPKVPVSDADLSTVEVFSSTNPLFNDAAVEAVRRWRYRPALMNGRPVRVYFSVVVDFLVR